MGSYKEGSWGHRFKSPVQEREKFVTPQRGYGGSGRQREGTERVRRAAGKRKTRRKFRLWWKGEGMVVNPRMGMYPLVPFAAWAMSAMPIMG